MVAANRYGRGRDLGIAIAVASIAGLTASLAPVGIAVIVGLIVLVGAARLAGTVPTAVVAACAIYGGVYLTYRISLGGVPVSALDAAPVCALVAGLSLTDRVGLSVHLRWAYASIGLFAIGVVTGVLLAFLHGGFGYQSGRVLRVEALLIVSLVASVLGGTSEQWRLAVVRGLMIAAFVAASLQIASEVYQLAVGSPLWSLFPFGSDSVAGLSGLAELGDVSNTRDNLLATYVMLPAISLLAYRLQGRDAFLLGFLVVASIASLSRSMWLATIVALLAAWVVRRALGHRLSVTSAGALVITTLVVVVSLNTWAGALIGARASSSLSSSDISASYRSTETSQTLSVLSHPPSGLVTGLGAGAFVPPIGQGRADPTPILENEMLARLTNFGLASILGTVLLLVSASWAAFQGLRRDPQDPLFALALALPSVLAISMISGVVLQLQVTLPFWILAGTVLAAPVASRAGRPGHRLGPAGVQALGRSASR